MKYLLYHINFDVKGENYINLDGYIYSSEDDARQAARDYLMSKNAQNVSKYHEFGDKFMHTGRGYKYDSFYGSYKCAVLILSFTEKK